MSGIRIHKRLNRRLTIRQRDHRWNKRHYRLNYRKHKEPLIPITEVMAFVWAYVDRTNCVNPKDKYVKCR